MSKPTSILSSVPSTYSILFNRIVIFILSVAALAVYAATLSIYSNSIAPTGAPAPPHVSPTLNINIISLVPSVLSIIWSITHLTLLARRLIQTHSRGRRRNSNGGEEWTGSSKAVVHPGWALVADGVGWAWFLAMAVLTGTAASKWKAGKVQVFSTGSGSTITNQVNLNVCPTFDPASGKMDYWCGSAWGRVVDLTTSSNGIVGTLAGMYLSRAFVACYELYVLRRYGRTVGCHGEPSVVDEDAAALTPRHQTKDTELERT